MFPTAVIFFKIGSGLFDVFINDRLSLNGYAAYRKQMLNFILDVSPTDSVVITIGHSNANDYSDVRGNVMLVTFNLMLANFQ